MSAQEDSNPTFADDTSESKTKSFRPGKEKKKRRRSRSKQKDAGDTQYFEQEYPYNLEDDGDNSCSSTPKYERNDEPCYPSGGLICALCYCGERSLLGQGDITRYSPSSGFNPFKKPPLRARGSRELLYGSSPGSNGSQEGYSGGEKVTKTAAVQRRGSKHMRETVKPMYKTPDYIDELSTVGCSEVLDVSLVFEPAGHVTAHHCCAAWSEGVTQNENYNLLCVDKAVHAGMSQRCHSCSRYGATIKCRAPKCERLFHYPCAAGSGCFQDIKSMSLLCTDHLELAPTIADPDELNCAVCDDPGQISDLLFCTSCGHHYHGDCLDPHVDVNPVVRAGWQCPECKICQTCRQPGDDNKMLVCDVCDKGYHTFCLRPAMTFIPKNGWCCKNCRRCTDCGSRTPGNGPSSRWHINYQVCDSCYQLRNKGSSCPVCGKAYRNISSARVEMTQCSGCKKWVHWGCEEASHIEACQKPEDDYMCPRCRNPCLPVEESSIPHANEPVGSEDPSSHPVEPVPIQGSTFSTPPPSESGGTDQLEEEMESVAEQENDIKPPLPVTPILPLQSPTPAARKRASTSSSIGSDKANFALKGSSLDPMLCVGEDSSDVGENPSLAKANLGSPPRKIRHMSSDGTPSGREKPERRSSADSNLSSIFTDENVQDTMSLFGVESLPHPGPTKSLPQTTAIVLSPEAKTYKIPESFVPTGQPKVSLSPLGSPQSFSSPPRKPPGPGMGKPGGMFGKGKPFGHKRRPGAARSRGKGKGHKRGSWSGARKRQRGGIAGKGTGQMPAGDRAYTASGHRGLPRRPRGRFQRQCSAVSPVAEAGPASPITKTEPLFQVPPADDEYGDSMHNTVVLCSTEDKFTLSQDMCVVCGSFGKGSEGRLVTCSQCGQCYHPYCVNLKLTKVVLRKGWRCLDCTVCEECGQVDDPAHLLLCDDCDISYHTHCLRPPLQHVPKGGWKCKWCVRCVHCGSTSPGKNCEWASNYTSCGPCASLTHCPRCKRTYKDEDIIMQCGTCERWLHAMCECLFTESDIEKVLEKGYDCIFCRPKDAVPPHIELGLQRENESMYDNFPGSVYPGRTRSDVDTVKEYHKDYTALTMTGLQHIQRQMQKYMGHHKKRPPGPRRRGQKHEVKHVPPVHHPVKPEMPVPLQSAVPAAISKDISATPPQATGDNNLAVVAGAVPALHPTQFPSAGGVAIAPGGDLSSATITATEDSGMEGTATMTEMGPLLPEGLKSPTAGLLDPKLVKIDDFPGESSLQGASANLLGIQTSSKKRRKPYRPGIGGFTVRQRGRGGGLLKPRSRRGLHHRVLPSDKSGTNDTKSDTLASETTSDNTVPMGLHAPFDMPAQIEGTAVTGDKPQIEGGALPIFKPGPAGPIASVVSPLKLKISNQPPAKTSTRRKKRVKLIDQFPPYLQDAFFGKKIISDAKAKVNPLDNMEENPASPGSSYGPKHSKDSCLILPDRLTMRLEAQAAAQAALHNQASTSHGDSRSQRHPSQPQDEDAILNEQELLGVLPDFPFKDDEILGILSMKQEQGASDSHENILSPSALEKMVTDGLAHIDGDMADLFSDVLNNDTKQDNLSLEHAGTTAPGHSERQQDMGGQHQTAPLHKASHSGMGDDLHVQNAPHDLSMPPSSMQAPGNHPQVERPRQMMIQQEMQQMQMKQQQFQQKQSQGMHEQQMMPVMPASMPPGGFGMSQPNQGVNRTLSSPGMNQGHQMIGPTHTSMGVVAQLGERPLSRSHHGTPVMSPVPNMTGQQQPHPMSHISPHPTPPPPSQFMRQASMPASLMSGMQTTHSEIPVQQMQHPSQISPGMRRLPQSTTPPHKGTMQRPMHLQSQTSLVDTRLLQPASIPPRPMSGFAEQVIVTVGQVPPQFQPTLPHGNEIQPGPNFQNQAVHTPGTTQRFQQVMAGSSQRTPVPPDSYSGSMSNVQQQPMGSVHGPPPPLPVTHAHNAPTPSILPQRNVVQVPGVEPQNFHSSASQAMPQNAVSATVVVAPSTPTKSSSVGGVTTARKEERLLVPTQLPDFSNDSNLFEPSPRPWPLGTELEGDSLSVNQRNILKWEKDEPLGELATISPVLYANVKFKDLKKEFPDWPTRAKQVAKLWRKASSDERAPFLLKARDNRALSKASRTRRGDDSSTSKTPTPPITGEEMEAKAVTTQSIKQEAHVHSQLAQVQQLLQEFEQVSSQGQQLQAVRPIPELSEAIPDLPRHATIGITTVPSTSPPMYQAAQAPAVEGTISSLTTQHSFAKPKSRPPTPKSQSPIVAAVRPPPEYPLAIKQQPQPGVPTAPEAYETATPKVPGLVSAQIESQVTTTSENVVKLVQAKVERQHSSDVSAQSGFPYPQSHTPIQGPSVQDSPSKGFPLPVTRSLSVGAQSGYQRSQTPRGKVSEQNSSNPALQPTAMDMKNRRLSVDSQVTRMASPDVDIKPPVPMSPTQTQMRQAAIYQQRSSRRARLWEQQSQPPPPYPAQTSPGGTQAFIYTHPRHQMMQMQGPRVGLLSPVTGAQTILRAPSPGVLAFQFDASAPHGFPPGHPMTQPHGFAAGVMPVKGYKGPHPPGAYIELTHSTQSDPATRRQNILRMASACSSTPTTSHGGVTPAPEKPAVPESTATTEQAKATTDSIVTTSAPSDVKSDDPFMGGHMPQDEHLDALLRSDEFKHLHFQGTPGTSGASDSTEKGDLAKVPTPASLASSVAAALSGASSTKLVTLTPHISPTSLAQKSKDADMSGAQDGAKKQSATEAPATTVAITTAADSAISKPDKEKTEESVSAVSKSISEKSQEAAQKMDPAAEKQETNKALETMADIPETEKDTSATQEKSIASSQGVEGAEKNREESSASIQGDSRDARKDSTSETDRNVSVEKKGEETNEKKLPGILKTDHSYFKSGEGKPSSDARLSAVTEKSPVGEKAVLKVDLSKEVTTSLRGVGLTPPPDSEVAVFVPTLEGEPPQDLPPALMVSNVITVPGTPPASAPSVKPPTVEKIAALNEPTTDKSNDKSVGVPAEEDGKIAPPVEGTEAVSHITSTTAADTKTTETVQPISNTEEEESKSQTEASDAPQTAEKRTSPGKQQKLRLSLDNLPTVNDTDKSSPNRSFGLSSMPKSPTTPPLTWKPEAKRKISTPQPESTPVPPTAKEAKDTESAEKTEGAPMEADEPLKEDEEPKAIPGKMDVSKSTVPASNDERGVEKPSSTEETTETKSTLQGATEFQDAKPSQADSTTKFSPCETEAPHANESQRVSPSSAQGDTAMAAAQPTDAPKDPDTCKPDEAAVALNTDTVPAHTLGTPSSPSNTTELDKDLASQGKTPAEQNKTTATQQIVAATENITKSATDGDAIPPPSSEPSTHGVLVDEAAAGAGPGSIPSGEEVRHEAANGTSAPCLTTPSFQGGIATTPPQQPANVPMTQGNQPLQTAPPVATPPMGGQSQTGTPSAQINVHTPGRVSTGPNTLIMPQAPVTPTPTSVSPPKTNISPSKDDPNKVSQTTPPRQKPLLIKEQPLLLQELLEEEKREQERARLEKLRHTQTLLQQQVNVPAQGISGVFPVQGVDMGESVTQESGIDKIKMKFLSRINQAQQGGLAGVPPPAPVDSAVAVQGASPIHQQPVTGRWQAQVPGPPLQPSVQWMGSDSEVRKYRSWLIQHQQVMQIQIPKQEQLVQTKKLRKQALMKKRNQCKRNGKPFAEDDAEELKVVTKHYTEAQQQLEKLRNDQKQHAELIQEFNIKQQRMMGVVGPGTPGAGGTLVTQQPQDAAVMEGQLQQQIMMPQSGTPTGQPQQHILVPPYQAQGIQGGGRMPSQGMPSQQQLIMMQQGQQQLIIKNVPTASHPDTSTTPSSSTASVPGRILQQQQPQGVTATQQQLQQQALIAQLQNMPGMSSPSQAQLHQLMINQHQLQQQQLQQQLKQKTQIQPALKAPQPRPTFVSTPPGVAAVHTAVTSAGGNPTHNAFMQMQMQQLMALQIEQQRAAFQQTPEKPKPKRKRKKKKTQAEKEAEEQQQLLARQQQQMQQMPVPGNLPVTNQQHPGTWYHRPMGPAGMQQMQQHIRPQGVVQHQQRFGIVPGQPMQMQHGVPPTMLSPGQNRFGPPTPASMASTSGCAPGATTPTSQQLMNSQCIPHTVPPAPTTPLQSQTAALSTTPHSMTPTATIPTQTSVVSHSAPQIHPTPQGVSMPMTTQAGPYSAMGTPPSRTMTSIPVPTQHGTTSVPTSNHFSAGMLATPTPHRSTGPTVPASTSVISAMPSTPSSSRGQMMVMSSSLVSPPTRTVSNVSGGPMPLKTEAINVPVASSQLQVSSHAVFSQDLMKKEHPFPAVMSTPTFHPSVTPPGLSSLTVASLSSAERTSPRIHSPGQGMASFEGLSEAEIAILMENDPDLYEESANQASVSASAVATATPPPTLVADQEDKNAKEEIKKKKRPKRGYVMDQRTIETIDDSISDVIRLSVEYEDKKQAAKGQEGAEPTPTPWEIEPKPTKFPKKPPENLPFGGMGDPHGDPSMMSATQGNKELLKHMLKGGQAAGAPSLSMQETVPGMFGQVGTMFGMPGMAPGTVANVPYSQAQPGMGMVGPPYMMQPGREAEVVPGQKKKRARRGSKDPGPDGKVTKRRRKKDKNAPQGQVYQVPGSGEAGGMPGQRFQVMPTVHPAVPFAPPGVAANGTPQVTEQATVWKRLPLLALVEPEIRKTHHMCVPKGTGLTECRKLLGGEIGDSTYKGIPDLYELYLDLEKPPETSPVPPTPPASLPPSPTHNQKQHHGQMTQMGAKTETTHSGSLHPTVVSETMPLLPVTDTAAARLATADSVSMLHRPPMVKVPESLPTPPHQGIEDKDEAVMIRATDNAVMPPSSPEMDEEDDWSPRWLTSLRHDVAFCDRQPSPLPKGGKMSDGSTRDTFSPGLPLAFCPQIGVPTDVGRRRGPLNDKDSVSVTIEFDNANIKSIEKSLTLLSRILDTSIISYSMVDMIKPDKKLKEALNQAIKEEQVVMPTQNNQNQGGKNVPPEVDGMPRQRRCAHCNTVVAGNGVRKPQFDVLSFEEDIIYCNKDCYIEYEHSVKKVSPVPVKKKFKASHVYQRHTCKISMATLLEKYPEEDPITPSKSTRSSSVDADQVSGGVQGPLRGSSVDRGRGRGRRRGIVNGADDSKVAAKRWRGLRWKKWSVSITIVKPSGKPPVDVDALLAKYGSALKPTAELIDRRTCVFCGCRGDGDTHTIARLLNVDVDQWVHLNCALWSAEVYETQGGALINVDLALRRSESVMCCFCQKKGATIRCHRPRCINTYHCQCALDIKCVFFKDKTVLCPTHAPKPGMSVASGFSPHQHHHSGDTLRSLAVFRKVYVQRPETKQIASIMQQGELAQGEKNFVLRVGALIFENVGQLATHQMAGCHSKTAIYPVGYKATRIYWSSTNMRRRCRYQCTVTEVEGKPKFHMAHKAALPGKNKPDRVQTHADTSTESDSDNVNELWLEILKPLEKLRSQHNVLKLFPDYINGEKLFGLTAPVVTRILESLPNIELCGEYKFRYGRTPLLEVPLAINPTGCARSEPHIKQHRKKPHTLISNLISEYYESSGIGDASSLYGKQFVHSKSSQYRKMKCEWRSNVYLARSRIQGLGLFAARDIEPGTMVIEYIGDIIRIEVSEKREKMYEATNRGVYMFRLDSDHIVDATVTGGPARYINHSCKPNCVAEVVNFEKEKKIMIVSNRHILKGEELSYDYKFDFEDEGRKIPCLCGASNCKKWMN